MQQRRMGRTGLKVSNICLGTMTFAGQADEATSRKILDEAYAQGVTFIDTADAYPIPPEPETAGFTEEVIGGWLAAERGRRDGLVAGHQVPDPGRPRAQRPGALAAPHPESMRRQPAAAEDRSHRPLPGPLARPRNPHRRDPARV